MLNQNEEKDVANMKAIFIGLFLIVLIAVITIFRSDSEKETTQEKRGTAPQQDKEKIDTTKIQKMSAEDLAKNIRPGSDLTLIDLRDNTSYQKEHIIDSINIPISNISSFSKNITKNKNYILIDEKEDAFIINSISDVLPEKGYEKIYYLEGGFAGWKKKFNPTISDGNQESFTDQAKVKYITSDELKKLMETEKNLIIIDVRENAEFNSGHLARALNIPLNDLEKRRREIPLGRNIILYENTVLGAFKGAVRLFDLGFSNALVLSGGLENWKNKGYEIVK